ncbi:hypothetical protein [Actinacidiphila oryziradicis]|jgi:hypothetical protein|uniref:Uncharacterized protein n=1 Tax=Actinacidiphila oryziradicis TaxID=2571141 RepID=A0A4U0SND7_9ACTN|nr:hypothetical protein [Actinacidiphila oryziradicis]MCW2874721.1 hypothetical protein [Actinacidiphila oryziradicis]TKA10693.1 hypothetical protein FCI23_15420 [Actinacidiphila oryziradicis]
MGYPDKRSLLRDGGIIAGVLATVLLGPSAVVASALEEANRAPQHSIRFVSASSAAAEVPRAGYAGAARNRSVPA